MIDEYALLKCIGKGAFGEVYLTSRQNSTKLFATKKVPKQKADSPAIKKYFKNELAILKEINHKYIIHLETIKHTIHNYYIITEYCNGGGLSDCLKKYKTIYGKPFPEVIVQHLMRQIVEALKYLHGRRIIHRDLKLDNILVNFENEIDKNNINMLKAQVKIIDFGFATHLGSTNMRYSTLGSPINMDPILLKKLASKSGAANLIGYDEKADIWSLGTVCYEMLIGEGVFNAENMIELIRKVEYGNYHVPTNLSKEVVSFLNGMLQYNSKLRLSAEELSRHHFLTKNIKDFKHMDLTKVSHKIDYKGLNINIKRNQSIWAIFKEEDEKALIDIPGKYLNGLLPIQEQDEYSVTSQNTETKNPFAKANNNNNLLQQPNINYQQNVNNNIISNNQNMVNYTYNNAYPYGAVTYNNYYLNGNQKYYNANLNGKTYVNHNTQINTQAQAPIYQTPIIQTVPTTPIQNTPITQIVQNTPTIQTIPKTPIVQNVPVNQIIPTPVVITPQNTPNIQTIPTNQITQKVPTVPIVPTVQTFPGIRKAHTQKNIVYQNTQNTQNNQLLLNQYPYQPYQYSNDKQNNQYTLSNKTNNVNNVNVDTQKAQKPVSSQQQIISQGYYQPSSEISSISSKTNQNIKIQKPIIVPNDTYQNQKEKNKKQLKDSKISTISNVTTQTEVLPPGFNLPKYDNYYTYNEQKNEQRPRANSQKTQTQQINSKTNTNTNTDKQVIYGNYTNYQPKPTIEVTPQPTISTKTQLQQKTNQYDYQSKNKGYPTKNDTKSKQQQVKPIEKKYESRYKTNTYNTYNEYIPQNEIKPKMDLQEPKNNLRRYSSKINPNQLPIINIDINASTNEDNIISGDNNKKLNYNNKGKYSDKYVTQKNYRNIDMNASTNDDNIINQKNNQNVIDNKNKYNNINNEYKNRNTPKIKITKLENQKDIYQKKEEPKKRAPLDFEEKDYKIVTEFNDPFPMPEPGNNESPLQKKEEKKEKENENENSNSDDSSEDLDGLIDFKLGDELCPEPENSSEDKNKDNEFKNGRNGSDDEDIDLPMKKYMERVVERPTIGVPPPGTDPKDNYECDDDYNNGVFQTNHNKEYYDDDY